MFCQIWIYLLWYKVTKQMEQGRSQPVYRAEKNKGEMGIKLWENSPRTLTFRTQNTASEKCKQSSCKEESLRIGSAIWEPTVLNACVILKSKSTSKSSRWRMWGSKPVKYRPEFRFLFALIVAAYLQPRSTGLNLSK